jgi:hypothetical protein
MEKGCRDVQQTRESLNTFCPAPAWKGQRRANVTFTRNPWRYSCTMNNYLLIYTHVSYDPVIKLFRLSGKVPNKNAGHLFREHSLPGINNYMDRS